MKRNIISGIILIGALALGSCSTTKLASSQLNQDDDVYFSKAKAGDLPQYVTNIPQQQQNTNDNYNNNDDDYYYYDSYASRINRFNYTSPFSYYDGFYDGFYSPYTSSFGIGFGVGYGLGGYYGYSPYYSPFGYYGYGYYSPYSYYGTGYGNSNYWGIYSGNQSTSPRPYRGSGAPNNSFVNRGARPVGYNGNYPVNSNYPGRPAVNSTSGSTTNGASTARPARTQAQPSYQPQPRVVQSAPAPSAPAPAPAPAPSSGGGYSGGGGGGGSRPARP